MNSNTTISYPYIFNSLTGKSQLDYDIMSINNCLTLLLGSTRNELLGEPSFGTNLYQYLFEHSNEALYDLIKADIVETVNKYEKRITVAPEYIYITPGDNNDLYINIKYLLKNAGILQEYNLNIN